MKEEKKIYLLAFIMSLLLIMPTVLYADDVQVILPDAGDAFNVEQPAGTIRFEADGSGNVSVPSLNCTGNANGGKVTTNASGRLQCGNDNVGVANCSDCAGTFSPTGHTHPYAPADHTHLDPYARLCEYEINADTNAARDCYCDEGDILMNGGVHIKDVNLSASWLLIKLVDSYPYKVTEFHGWKARIFNGSAEKITSVIVINCRTN
jgi:hypothetical protein